MNETSATLYERIVTDIRDRIANGLYRPGEKIDSLNLLCTRYGVSKITAIRAIDELQSLGLLRIVAGKGSYVTGVRYERPDRTMPPPLRKIIICAREYVSDTTDANFNRAIFNSIVTHCCTLGLDVQIRHIRESEIFGSTQMPVTTGPDEGIIALARDSVISMLYLFTNPNCRRVMIDTVVAGIPNVLSDNYNGVRAMLEHLVGLGHRHILFAARFADGQNFVNENERLEAFIHLCTAMNIKAEIVTSGDFNDIFHILKRTDRPSAVFFSRDDPALKLITELEALGIDVPSLLSVTGFDDCAEDTRALKRLTTVRADTARLGIEAVERLFLPLGPSYRVPLTTRVPVSLVVRASSGPAAQAVPLIPDRQKK